VSIKLSSPSTQQFWELSVLYEDDHLLALDKPAGLLSAPDQDHFDQPGSPNLLELLHKAIADAKPWAKEHGLSFVINAYMLELQTSGVLLLAKSRPVLNALSDLFGNEQSNLTFVTLVRGAPAQNLFSVNAKLAPHPVRPGLMRASAKFGKRSRTDFEVIERFSGWTLLKCLPLTHRPDQIRAHLTHARFPIAGDLPYGGKALLLSMLKRDYHLKPKHSERPLIGSACLHAEQLALNHPVTGEHLVIKAPWPKNLSVAVKYLRKYAAANEAIT
jgi:RluA family pseudouridine synthase